MGLPSLLDETLLDIRDLPMEKRQEVFDFVQFLKSKYKKSDNTIKFEDFSFKKSQSETQTYKGSFGEAVIEERNAQR